MNLVLDTLVVALVFATLAQAWCWLGAYAGIVSLGNAVFFGIGAYAVAVSNLRGGSPWYGALGGALAAVIVAAGCGLFLGGRGYVFSALTLAAGVAAEPLAQRTIRLGNTTHYAFPRQIGFLHLQFSEKWPYLVLALCVFGVAQALTIALRTTRIGMYLRALRSNAVAARGSGIAARPLQLLTLVAGAFVTSVAGSFFAEYRLAVDPQTSALGLSLDIALIGVIAGSASPWGAPSVALLYTLVTQVVPLHPPGAPGYAVLGIEAVLVLLAARYFPHGIFAFERPRIAARSAA